MMEAMHTQSVTENTGTEPQSTLRVEDVDVEIAESETERKWSRVRVYGFQLGPLNLLLPQGLYCELLNEFRLSILPNVPRHFAGLVPVRGNLVPVYQLQPLMGMPIPRRPYVFVLGSGQRCGALLISQKPVMQDFTQLEETPMPTSAIPDVLQPAVIGCYRSKENAKSPVWLALDHVRLFSQLISA